MKNIKKIIMTVICMLIFAATTNTAQAYDDMKQTEDGWVYRTVDADRQIMIHDYVGTETNVHIPESIEGLPVTSINTSEFNDSDIIMLHISKNVKYITFEMFGNDSLLKIESLEQIIVDEANQHYKSVDGVLYSKDGKTLVRVPIKRTGAYVVPDSVETIGGSAFSYTGITSIKVGKKVKLCGISFQTCKKLKKILVDKKNRYYSAKDGVLYNKKKTKLLGCVVTKRGYFKMPSTVKDTDYGAFAYCDKLTKVKMSDNIRFFRSDMFWHCTRLSEVIIGKKTKRIDADSFVGTSVKKLVIPKSVKEIAPEAFCGSTSLKKVVIKGTRTDIREAIAESYKITYYVPKKALKWYKKQLKNVDMGDNKLVGI